MAEQIRPEAMRLRAFVEADDAEVSSWFADAGELRFFAGPRLRWPLDSGQWRSIRLDPSVAAWTAVLDDDAVPVGHGELISESPEVIRLARLAVSPALRGYGLGRALLSLLAAQSRESRSRLLTVAVHPDNTTAIVSYRRFGFESSADPLMDATGQPLTGGRLRMELVLEREK